MHAEAAHCCSTVVFSSSLPPRPRRAPSGVSFSLSFSRGGTLNDLASCLQSRTTAAVSVGRKTRAFCTSSFTIADTLGHINDNWKHQLLLRQPGSALRDLVQHVRLRAVPLAAGKQRKKLQQGLHAAVIIVIHIYILATDNAPEVACWSAVRVRHCFLGALN